MLKLETGAAPEAGARIGDFMVQIATTVPGPSEAGSSPAPLPVPRSVDLSWADAFHTVSIARWSEPPGPDGYQCQTWRVLIGAFGRYVSANDPDLDSAITAALRKAGAEPLLQPLLPDSSED